MAKKKEDVSVESVPGREKTCKMQRVAETIWQLITVQHA